MHSHDTIHKSEHFKNGSGFLRSIFRNDTGFKQNHNKMNPFHGEDLSNFNPHSETWTRGPNLPNNISAHSSTPPPTATYKVAPKPHETDLLSNASPSSNYIENTIRRNRHRSIPPRFEHRLNPALDKPTRIPPEQNATWRPGPDRGQSGSYDTQHNRERVVAYQGLRTADLSNRTRYVKRENFISTHPPPSTRGLPAYPTRRNPGRAHVKDRLYMPPQQPERVVKRQERFGSSPTCSDTDANGLHVRSNTQNDPRIRSSQGTPPDEEKDFSSEACFQPINPAKTRGKSDQFFDEETQMKQEDNFDVPLPPTVSSELSIVSSKQQDIVQIPDEGEGEKDHGNDTQSFWDETDELNLIKSSKNTENPQVIYPPVRTVTRVENPRISFEQNSGSFFDDDITTSTPYASKSAQPQRSSHHSKQPREHTSRRSVRHTHDKLRKDKRKVSPVPVRIHHVKKSPKKIKFHSHSPQHSSSSSTKLRQKDAKITPAALISHSNAPILKLNTKSHTHIRLKKTVNLADKESEHSSTDDCTEMVESRKLVIPLPNSPLQPLEVITGEEQVSTLAPAQVDISEIETVVSSTRNASEYVEVQEGPCQVINFTPRPDMNRPVRSLEDFLKFRHQSISESSDIGLHIEFIGDYSANSPSKQIPQAAASTAPSNACISLLNIESFKPISPKSDLETPDSVFTPGFDSSQQIHTVFSLDRPSPILHSPVYPATAHSSARNDSTHCEEESKYVSKHRSVKCMKRRSTRKSKPLKKTNSDNSLGRTDGDSNISSNTREVCIPLTRLDMTQYGAKVKGTSQVPENVNSKEKQIIKGLSQWKCMFCHRGANESNLGYLYGPYFKTGENLKVALQPISARKKASRDYDENELWVHAPCALWSPGVFLVSFHLRGLVEAFESSQSMKCSGCGHNGATLRCEKDGCSSVYHYTCAENINCRFNHDCFQLQCPKHISKLTNNHTPDL